jgi:nucleoid DNA-binding protein
MKKSDLVAKVIDTADISQHDADNAVTAIFEHITNALARKDDVSLVGFGSFVVKARAARMGRNPSTGDAIEIAASNNVQFRPGKSLKDAVNDR